MCEFGWRIAKFNLVANLISKLRRSEILERCVVADEPVLEEDHWHLFRFKHGLEAVQVLKSLIRLQSVDLEYVRIDSIINHVVSDVLQLVVEAIDNDEACPVWILPLLLHHLLYRVSIQIIADALLLLVLGLFALDGALVVAHRRLHFLGSRVHQ